MVSPTKKLLSKKGFLMLVFTVLCLMSTTGIALACDNPEDTPPSSAHAAGPTAMATDPQSATPTSSNTSSISTKAASLSQQCPLSPVATTTDTAGTPSASETPTPGPTDTSTPEPTVTATPDTTASPTANPTEETATPTVTPCPTGPVSTPVNGPVTPSQPGTPKLTTLDQVTDQAYGQDGQYVPNSWGNHKQRIVRTRNGTLFTVYISPGTVGGDHGGSHTYHVMRLAPGAGGSWQDVKSGDAGAEEANIVVDPKDGLHVFTFPGFNSMHEISSSDLGQTWTEQTLPGDGQWFEDQGYVTASTNAQGDMIAVETGDDVPGVFYYDYYDHSTQQWSFHTAQTNYRYTYAYFFLGSQHSVDFVGMRDAKPSELGYGYDTGQSMQWIFNRISAFHIDDVLNPKITETKIVEVMPKQHADYDVTYLLDAYQDSAGQIHALYDNLYDGPHEAIVSNGQVVKDVHLDISAANKMRITQDSKGHFYVISMDATGNSINVYPGTASDTDGTQLSQPTKLDISKFQGCTDDDFCGEPTFTVPRGGNALSNTLDAVYGNFTHVYHASIALR